MCLVLLVVCRSLPSDVALPDDDEEDEEEEDEVERWTTLLSLLPAELPTVEKLLVRLLVPEEGGGISVCELMSSSDEVDCRFDLWRILELLLPLLLPDLLPTTAVDAISVVEEVELPLESSHTGDSEVSLLVRSMLTGG